MASHYISRDCYMSIRSRAILSARLSASRSFRTTFIQVFLDLHLLEIPINFNLSLLLIVASVVSFVHDQIVSKESLLYCLLHVLL